MDKKDRISQFIQSFLPERTAFLEEIRKEALSEAVPILREETAALLRVCLKTKEKPKILELGTAVGYSALVMMDALGGEGEIVTVENFPPRIEKAKQNFGASPYQDKITLLEGDGSRILEELLEKKEQFSFDASSGETRPRNKLKRPEPPSYTPAATTWNTPPRV